MNTINIKDVIWIEICYRKKMHFFKILHLILFNIQLRFIFLFRLACLLKKKKIRFLPGVIFRHLVYRYGCFMNLNSDIGIGLKIPHPNGIVIGEKVQIGKNCTIYQQVTIGGKIIGDAKAGNYPKIKDNVVIFAGAKLIGNINVGEHSIVGANSVVNKNVPSNSVVAGVPAKIIKNICYE